MASIQIVPPSATWDPDKEKFTSQQVSFARADFELIQAIRREKSMEDPDSPGKLTPMEILQNIALKSPAVISGYVDMAADESSDVKDLIASGYLVQVQLLE